MTNKQNAGRRPYFKKVIRHTWTSAGHPDTPGIALIGLGGYSAHLTASEAIELSNRLVDLAETLDTEQHQEYTS